MSEHTRPKLISAANPHALTLTQRVLEAGGIVAFPTDTVYGIAATVANPLAIEKLYAVKGRAETKAIAVLIGDVAQLNSVAEDFPPGADKLARRFWPGPLTLVVPRHPSLPEVLSHNATIGVRMPGHPFALALLRHCGPLAVTSANLSGAADACTAAEVRAQLGDRIELIVDGGSTPGAVPSTVVDCVLSPYAILRPGPVSADEINAALLDPGES